jgi:hypothetical protein
MMSREGGESMAQPAPLPDIELPREPSFEMLGILDDRPWTAQLALDLLPAQNGPRVEVFRGSVIVTPHAGFDHQEIELEAAGGVLAVKEPFEFSIDPADLLDDIDTPGADAGQ